MAWSLSGERAPLNKYCYDIFNVFRCFDDNPDHTFIIDIVMTLENKHFDKTDLIVDLTNSLWKKFEFNIWQMAKRY